MRYVALGVAIILDFLQITFAIAFTALQFLTPVGGGVAGAASAASVCYGFSGTVIEGVTNAIKCAAAGGFFGTALSAFAIPLGAAIDTTLSITLGGAVLFLLAWDGAFYWERVMGGSIVEVLPFFNFVPAWTYLAWRCIQAKKQDERRAASPTTAPAQAPAVAPFQANHFRDITPRPGANDNRTSYANAA